jgi:hypothetical protein
VVCVTGLRTPPVNLSSHPHVWRFQLWRRNDVRVLDRPAINRVGVLPSQGDNCERENPHPWRRSFVFKVRAMVLLLFTLLFLGTPPPLQHTPNFQLLCGDYLLPPPHPPPPPLFPPQLAPQRPPPPLTVLDRLFWVHFPKCGTSFGLALLNHACPALPTTAVFPPQSHPEHGTRGLGQRSLMVRCSFLDGFLHPRMRSLEALARM